MTDDFNSRIADVWASASSMAELDVLASIDALVAERDPEDARAAFEAASARDFVGLETEAEPMYRRAIELGLEPGIHEQAVIQLASTLRNLDRTTEAIRLLEALLAEHPDDEWTSPAAAFLALALASRGDDRAAASVALTALSAHLPLYAGAVRRYAVDLVDPA